MSERENKLFEEWWENEGQYNRAGGGEYEKTFAYHAWMAVINRQGYKLVPLQPNNKAIVSIERVVENQIEASGITQDPFRLDGEKIYKAMIGAVE